MRLSRYITGFSSALCLVAGVMLSPLVATHVLESHCSGPEHGALDHASLEGPGHSHGDHDHATLEAMSQRVPYRLSGSLGSPLLASIQMPALTPATAIYSSHALTSKPPRSRHPLSLSNTLRI